MERKGEFDYDEVMNYYQGLLKREKEAFEGEKMKKQKDVEYLARAVREEEKAAIQKYALEHGEEEMKQIQRAVRERHEKELKMKIALDNAQGVFAKFKEVVMAKRHVQHEDKMQAFIASKGVELHDKIVEEAKNELRKVENIRKVKEAEEKRKRETLEKERKQKADGTYVAPDAEDGGDIGGWGRGVIKQAPSRDETSAIKKDEPNLGRSGFGLSKTASAPAQEDKPAGEIGRPTFSRGAKKDQPAETEGFMDRKQFG